MIYNIDFLRAAEKRFDEMAELFLKERKVRLEKYAYSASSYINMIINEIEKESENDK